jgi:hypothetical protein
MSAPTIPAVVIARVRASARERCGFCLAPQRLVLGWLEIEHLHPRSRGGSDREENLWLACRLCNNFKSDQIDGIDLETSLRIRLFDPRRDRWWDHFSWSEDGAHVIGRTPMGRVTVTCLQLNNAIALAVRDAWVSVGWHPPVEE